jgi:hypothetical protein
MKISYPFKNSVEGTANTKLEILNEGDCMYAWNNKRDENRVFLLLYDLFHTHLRTGRQTNEPES